MKVLLVGHSGVLGKIVLDGLANREGVEVVTASRTTGDFQVEIEDPESIRALFEKVKQVDALICTAGSTVFEVFQALTPEKNEASIASKLKGQINLVLVGQEYVTPGGSITLTSGIINKESIPTGASSAMVNGAIESFVRAAALEINNGVRLNAVSPGPLMASWPGYASFFEGFSPVEDGRVYQAFQKSLFGNMTGSIFEVH